ncbi:ATP-dependent RNA helicase [Strigomonas culicis]|nr:ATP-dependent RNA helicase [Strigomonas culicis]|eukprot:EPY26018.1 ATP-dependent RNA helicase [Strigomonas culicis]
MGEQELGGETNILEKLSQLFPDKVVRSEAAKPSAATQQDAAPPAREEGLRRSEARGETRGDRRAGGGRRSRYEDKEKWKQEQRQRVQEQYEKECEEAKRKHEAEMQQNPEYKKNYEAMFERQCAMETSQQLFFEKYTHQEVVHFHDVVKERLDIPVILDLIDQHDVVFVCTDTGSGKSTSIPKALVELSTETRVVSTQPRRTATVAIANRVAMLRREQVGEDVGYWIRGDKKGDEQTRLWYMTSYTLLLRLLENPEEIPYTHIVLDEFHEQQPDIEVMVALLRLALRSGKSKFKLILMSATLNTGDWEDYFSGLKVATYKQSEPEHPIHDYFLEDVCTLMGFDYTVPEQLMEKRVVEKSIMDKHLYIAQNLIMFLNNMSLPNHSILVFLPGRAQVEAMQALLLQQLRHRVDAIPWHSAVELTEIEAAMKRQSPNLQKVYLATDIVEVSITLPDVVFVIDLVLVKRPKISKEKPASVLYPPLVTQWVSKGSIAQRRGRVGRVQQGFYFCLFPAAQIATLADHPQSPIENSRIDELSLHCLQIVSNPVAIFSICHNQPHIETIASSMNTLTHLGCIIDAKDPMAAGERVPEIYAEHHTHWSSLILSSAQAEAEVEVDEYLYTFIGRMLQLIPVSPQSGMLVYYGFLTGLESLMILAAAVTSSLSPFTVGAQETGSRRFNVARAMEETENAMRSMCCGLRSDIVAVMKAVLLFRQEAARHGDNVQTVKQWCAQKNLSYDKLVAIVDMENHIKFELADFVPFRDIVDASKLLEQLDKLAAMVCVMTNVAFVAQSVEVTSSSSSYAHSKELAVGLFSDLSAAPDIHSPSCLRWQDGDIIIPVQLNLLFDKLLASFSTAIESPKQFWMSLLLFAYRLQYATFSDDEGTFYVFSVSYCGKERFLETDDIAGIAVLEFRQRLHHICELLRINHVHKDKEEEALLDIIKQYNLKPLQEVQRDVITALVTIFKNLEQMTVDEVQHEEDDLDAVSILSFALPQLP